MNELHDGLERTLEDDLEDQEALASESYLAAIREAREDYRLGRTVTLSPSPGEGGREGAGEGAGG
jgi:hypothetical protein